MPKPIGPPADDLAEIGAAIARMIDEIDQLRARMESDQTEIERMKADSQRLRSESDRLKVETRALLDTLRSAP
jgi:hypothetical protein